MKLHHSLLAAALLAAVSASAGAQVTGVAKLEGTIVPSSCTITIANAGVVDFGAIPYATLSQTAPTNLTPTNVSASFACSGATLFAFTAFDNRHATSGNPTAKYAYGVGNTPDGLPIGIFTIDMNTPMVDGAAGTVIASTNLSTWSAPAAGTGWEKANDATSIKYRGFGSTATGPVALTNASVNLRVTPNIRSRNQLQLTADATLDGNTTIELVYL